MAVDHLDEARVRVGTIETTEAQLALGQLDSTPQVHAELARLAQSAERHLWVLAEELTI
jgi:hypothetical protein